MALQPFPQKQIAIQPDGHFDPVVERWFTDLSKMVVTGAAPVNAPYVIYTANLDLTNDANLGLLTTGFLFITVAAGVAVPSSMATLPAASLTGILPALNGAALTTLTGANVTHSVVSKTFADTGYVAALDQTVLVDATGGATTINLPPSPTSGKFVLVKKLDASGNAVTVNGNGNNVDGAATQALAAQWNSFIIQGNGTAYLIVARL